MAEASQTTISTLTLLSILLPLQLPTLGLLAALFFHINRQTNSIRAEAREDKADLSQTKSPKPEPKPEPTS